MGGVARGAACPLIVDESFARQLGVRSEECWCGA